MGIGVTSGALIEFPTNVKLTLAPTGSTLDASTGGNRYARDWDQLHVQNTGDTVIFFAYDVDGDSGANAALMHKFPIVPGETVVLPPTGNAPFFLVGPESGLGKYAILYITSV